MTGNMHGFDADMKLQHYPLAEDIADAYIPVRQAGYVKRKGMQLEALQVQHTIMTNKARFINAILDGAIPMVGSRGADGGHQNTLTNEQLVEYLRTQGYVGKKGGDDSLVAASECSQKDFSYLLDMSISSLTIDRANSLNKRVFELETELTVLEGTTPEAMWLSDLAKLEYELNKDVSYTKR